MKISGWNRDCRTCRDWVYRPIKTLSDVKCNKCIGYNRKTAPCNPKKD